MKNRILALALVLALAVGIVPAYAAGATFSDVPSTHWAYQDVEAAVADHVLNGIGGGRFDPGGKLTIAEWSCILARGFYAEEVEAKTKTSWYNREMDTLASHAIFAGMFDEIRDVSAYAPRSLMAAMVANVLADKWVRVSADKLEPFKAGIADLDTIPSEKQNAVATCWALGIINGVGGNRFDGAGYVERGAAAAVYNRTKKALQNGGQIVAVAPDPVPTPEPTLAPGESHVVGTISSVKVVLNKDSIKTHAPVVDYWSSQPAEIQAIADKDSFNAAAQTIHDSEMIITQGEMFNSRNLYYNYAVVASSSTQAAKNVGGAMGALSGAGGSYGGWDNGSYKYSTITPYNANLHAAVDPILAQIDLAGDDRSIAEACVTSVCDRLDYEVNGGANWININNGTNPGKGDCQSYARMLAQLLSAAGIANIHVVGDVKNSVYQGGHAWVMAKLGGTWMCIDGVSAERGNGGIFTIAEHEARWGYSGANDGDVQKVARALIECAYPG